MTHDEVIQPLQGGQIQVSGQHVPLLGHGDAIESTNSNPLLIFWPNSLESVMSGDMLSGVKLHWQVWHFENEGRHILEASMLWWVIGEWCHITSTFKGLEMRAMWLFSHIYIKRIGHSDACEPWGYVAPVVAAFVTRATGVRHIYLIQVIRKFCYPLAYLEIFWAHDARSCVINWPQGVQPTDGGRTAQRGPWTRRRGPLLVIAAKHRGNNIAKTNHH